MGFLIDGNDCPLASHIVSYCQPNSHFFSNPTGITMTITNELTRQILSFLSSSNSYAFRVNSVGIVDRRSGITRTAPKKGISDILGVFNGHFFGIEIKVGKDRLSDEQRGFITNVEHFGGKVFVVHSFEDFKKEWYDWSKERANTPSIPSGIAEP